MEPKLSEETVLVYDMASFVKATRNLVAKPNVELDETTRNDLKLWADQLLRQVNHYRMSK